MTKLETIKQKIEADRKEQEQRIAELDAIRNQISALNAQIDDAISAGQNSTAEKLIIRQEELKTKLAIAERIGQRRLSPELYLNDLKQVSAEKAAELQPKADKAYEEMEKAHTEYLKKKVALAKILNEGAQCRLECYTLAGLGYAYDNRQYDEFASVQHHQLALDVYWRDKEAVLQMQPDYFIMAYNANSYGCFKE